MKDLQNEPNEKMSVSASPIINNFYNYGTIEKVIHEVRHDSVDNTAIPVNSESKPNNPVLQSVYWIVGIVAAFGTIYIAFFRK